MTDSIPRRRLWAGAIIGACLALCLVTGTASATLRLDTSTDTTTTIDEDVHWFESNLRTVTAGGYQYSAYWDAPDREGRPYLQLSRRRLSDNNVKTLRFDREAYEAWLTVPNDGHNFVGLGINANDGTIHVSYSLHTSDRRHRYWHSATRCAERTQEEFSLESCGFTFSRFQASSTIENSMTYPIYINDNRGRLYFTWRYDASARGDQMLNSYDEATHAWTLRGRVLRGRRWGEVPNNYEFEIEGRRYTARERGVYPIGWSFDKNERLHLSWVWRENVSGPPTQHGIHYAYSEDLGRTWYSDVSGRATRIAETEEDPIDINDLRETQVVALPPGWWVWGGGMTVDTDNNPHIFVPASDRQTADGLHINEREKHYWRTNDGTWYSEFIEPAESGSVHPTLPGIFFDRANVAYALYARDELGWIPWNSEPYTQAELPVANVTWQPNGERDGYLDVQLASVGTCIDTWDLINVPISTAGTTQLRLRARNNTTSTGITVSWTTEESTTYSTLRQQRFTRSLTANDRSYSEYTYTITDADWTGTLRELEICVDGPSTGSVSFDSIRLTDRAARAAKTWDFTRAVTMYAAEASPADNWSTWNAEEVLPGVSITREDSYWVIDRQRYAESRVVDFGTFTQGRPGTESFEIHSFDIVGDDVAKDWRFDADLIGWTAPRDISSFAQSTDEGRKVASGRLSGSDGRILSMANLKVPIGERTDNIVHVTMKNETASTTGHVYFITDSDRTFNETKSKTFTTTARSGYTTYDIDMSRVSGWSGSTLYQLRLDPSDDATRTGTFMVDRIWVSDS